jgi:hypothetical protein
VVLSPCRRGRHDCSDGQGPSQRWLQPTSPNLRQEHEVGGRAKRRAANTVEGLVE